MNLGYYAVFVLALAPALVPAKQRMTPEEATAVQRFALESASLINRVSAATGSDLSAYKAKDPAALCTSWADIESAANKLISDVQSIPSSPATRPVVQMFISSSSDIKAAAASACQSGVPVQGGRLLQVFKRIQHATITVTDFNRNNPDSFGEPPTRAPVVKPNPQPMDGSSLLGLLPIAVIALVIVAVLRWRKGSTGVAGQLICTTCGFVGYAKKSMKGSFGIELVLWLCLILPGLLYSLWRLTSKYAGCPACGNPTMIPVTTPVGQKLMAERASLPPVSEAP